MTKVEQKNNMHAYEDSSIITFSRFIIVTDHIKLKIKTTMVKIYWDGEQKKNEPNAKTVIRSQAKRQKRYQKGGQIQDPCCKSKL
jgi:hypothetical protein